MVEALIALIDPDNWTIDSALLARPGVDEFMLDLHYDIRDNRQTVADARQFFKGAPASGDDDRHRRQRPALPRRQHEAPRGYAGDRVPPIDSGHLRCHGCCLLSLIFNSCTRCFDLRFHGCLLRETDEREMIVV